MSAARLIRDARRRAGYTQRELAARAGTSQPAIARYERGETDPSFGTLEKILHACGFDLRAELEPRDDHDYGLALLNLRLSPQQRLDQLVRFVRFAGEARKAVRRGRGRAS